MLLVRIQKEVFNKSFFYVLYCFVMILVMIQIRHLKETLIKLGGIA